MVSRKSITEPAQHLAAQTRLRAKALAATGCRAAEYKDERPHQTLMDRKSSQGAPPDAGVGLVGADLSRR